MEGPINTRAKMILAGQQQNLPSYNAGLQRLNPMLQASPAQYDPTYDQDFADEWQQTPQRPVYPTPPFVPGGAFRSPSFVMPRQPAARDLGFDQMDLADRQYYQDRTFAPPQPPRMRRF